MRVKINDKWHDVLPNKSIMIQLSDADKRNIANMHPDADRYACFHDDDVMTSTERHYWMDSGYAAYTK